MYLEYQNSDLKIIHYIKIYLMYMYKKFTADTFHFQCQGWKVKKYFKEILVRKYLKAQDIKIFA